MKTRLKAWAACAIGALCVAGPAYAGDTACIWDGLPQASRDAFLATAPDNEQKALSHLLPSDEVLRPLLTRCGIRSRMQIENAMEALKYYALDASTTRVLFERYRLTPSQLDQAWLLVAPAKREALATAVLSQAEATTRYPDAKARELVITVSKGMARELGVTNARAIDQITQHLVARVFTLNYEMKY